MLQQTFKELLTFLTSTNGNWFLLSLGCVIATLFLYHRWKQIPGLTVELIKDETWFINRDDNNKLAIIISLHFTNMSSSPIQIHRCKLSGYSPKIPPEQMFLEGYDKTVELVLPEYDSYFEIVSKSENITSSYVLNPFTEQKMWVYYESGIVTLTNILRAPIVIKDLNRKRKSLQVAVPRNMEQIQLYREAAMRW
ncbi:hypothetical protein C6497_13340 [Candidatus Poribacteria bacterium]|nr:MAG: hypothetical protein C6497_13340 [Candidatus Poribacteria bacterium]